MTRRVPLILVVCACLVASAAPPVGAHGFAGKRFFPATLAVDDPFVADELSLPTVASIKRPAEGDVPAFKELSLSGEVAKRITPALGLSLAGEWLHLDPDRAASTSRFNNLEVGLKYQFLRSDLHETIMSLGVSWEVGGTGSKRVGADSFDTVTPTLFFGKGFGDLPEAMPFLRPFAVTGILGVGIPTRAASVTRSVNEEGEVETERERHPHTLQWGFAIEYSLPYLAAVVRDVGLPSLVNRLIGVVEIPLETGLDRGAGGTTTGSVNAGIIWAGRLFQVGLEAVFPINARSGRNVGVIGQLHFYLDDLFPDSVGRPLFGR